MMQTTLHIVFSPSAADTLMQALKNAGRDDQVIACPTTSASDRSILRSLQAGEMGRGRTRLERKATASSRNQTGSGASRFRSNHRLVAWLSRRSAIEYAGFLEWLWRLGERPCEVVDLTDLKVSHKTSASALGRLAWPSCPLMKSPSTVCIDRAQILPATARSRYHALWAQLRAENAPLRVLSADALVSVPISFFDSLLMSFATDDWRKVAMIVGLALGSEIDNYVIQSSDIFLAARVNALVETGRLELRGRSALEMRFSEVRLARPG